MKKRLQTFGGCAAVTASAAIWLTLHVSANVLHVPSGTWQTIGSVSETRTQASVTVTQNGRVLVAGGTTAPGTTASAELMDYDGTFNAVAPMSAARTGHVAVSMMSDGVLVLGGLAADGQALASAEIFDQFTRTWSSAGNMSAPRVGHSATVLQDRRVLIAGGSNTAGPVATIEVFDPATRQFSVVGTLSDARHGHAAVLLDDGRVLVTGGRHGSLPLQTAEIINSQTGETQRIQMSGARTGHSATTLVDGRVLVLGGHDGTSDLASAEIFDPASDQFSGAGSMTTPRRDHAAVLLRHNNSVLIAGGSAGGTALASAELFIPWTGQFSATGSLGGARTAANLALLNPDGRVIIAGGSDDAGSVSAVEIYGFAWIKTNTYDYVPNQQVVISGGGWQPDEAVTLTLHEHNGPHQDRVFDVTADSAGEVYDESFRPEADHAGVRFYLTAVGAGSQAQTTFTDSTATLAATKDTYLLSTSQTDNLGNDSKLLVRSVSTGDSRGLVEFDFGMIPAGVTVTSAELSLHKQSGSTGITHTVFPVTSAWVEGNGNDNSGATWIRRSASAANLLWTAAGGDFGAATDSSPTPSDGNRIVFDVVTDVQAIVNGAVNNGWIVRDTGSGNASVDYGSREASLSQRPQLVVIYSGNATTTTTVTTTPNPSSLGQTVTVTATVKSNQVNVTVGTVTFKQNSCAGATLAGPTAVVSGLASFSTNGFDVGTTTIFACYTGAPSGDITFLDSEGSAGHVVNTGGALPATKDTYIVQDEANDNFGLVNVLSVGRGSSPNSRRRGLVEFDLSGIPANAIVQSATLKLHKTGGPARTHTVHRLLQAWVEGTGTSSSGTNNNSGATWNTSAPSTLWSVVPGADITIGPGGYFKTTASASITFPGTNNVDISWNVTADVQSFVAGTLANQGWLIKDSLEDANALITYVSNQTTTQSLLGLKPRLEISFVLPSVTALQSSPNPSQPGQNVTFTAMVTNSDTVVTTGTVTFKNGGTCASGGTVLGSQSVDVNGQAVLMTSALPAGSHTILACYTDSNLNFGDSFATLVHVVNNPPDAVADTATVNEDSGANPIDVLANDTDPDNVTPAAPNAGLSVTAVTQGTNGSVAITGGGTGVTYTPNLNFFGNDSFTYTISDPLGSTDTATVAVTVNSVNDAPSFIKGADQTASEDSGPQTVLTWATSISAGPANEIGQTVMFLIDSNTNPGLFSSGPAVAPDGTLTYTAAANAFGTATIGVKVKDDGGILNGGIDTSAVQTFLITITEVNDPPVANADMKTATEDVALTFPASDLTANDTTGAANETQALTVTAVSLTSTAGGTVALIGGQITYTPAPDFNGADSFTYTVCDDGTTNGAADPKCANGTVNVSVTEVNDPPTAVTDAATVAEDNAVGVLVDVLANDTKGPANENAQTLTLVSIVTGPAHGTAVIESGQIRYTPTDLNFNGTDSFTYQVCDDGTTNGAADPKCAIGTVDVTVTEVNDPPTAVTDTATVAEDNAAGVLVDVLVNDTNGPANESAQTLTLDSVVTGPAHGTAVIESGQIRYTPTSPHFNGLDSFTYKVCDNGTTDGAADPKCATGTVNITVTEVNDPPVATDDAAATPEDIPLVLAASTLTSNDSPGPLNEAGQMLMVTSVGNASPAGASVSLNAGQITYVAPANYFGPGVFSYLVCDNGTTAGAPAPLCNEGFVAVTVTPVNDAPVANSQAVTTDEDTPVVITLGGSDIDSASLTFSIVTGPANGMLGPIGAPTCAPVSAGTSCTANVTYTPLANYFGPDSFTFRVFDGALYSSPATVTITVNRAPVFIVIDEDSIDNGSAPNNFSSNEINDNMARLGLRTELQYFTQNAGNTITLYTGQVGDEGWFGLQTIPASWSSASQPDGLRNFIAAGPGLGTGNDPETLLDKIPNVTPLRATSLAVLKGATVCAVVYDSDISMNYSPLNGSLKGANLGTVAFEITDVRPRTGGSSSSLPQVDIRILSAPQVCAGLLQAPPPPFTTYTQSGWDGTNPAVLTQSRFASVYPNNLSIGDANSYSVTFTTATAVKAFLSAGGKAKTLTASFVNPTSTPAGVVVGNVLALKLNVDFSEKALTTRGLKDLKVASGELAGKTVAEVLAIAESALAGGPLPPGLTIAGLDIILAKINRNFIDGIEDQGLLVRW